MTLKLFIKRTHFLLLVRVVLLFWPKVGNGQITTSFKHLTVEDGLSSNSVISIAQDKQGFMWFGTNNGLNRYDGHRFKEYKFNGANNVSALLCDKQGILWVGTGLGLEKFLPGRSSFKKIKLRNNDQSVVQKRVEALIADTANQLWIGTYQGLYLLHQSSDTFATQIALPIGVGDYICSLYQSKDGWIWVGTNQALVRMRGEKGNYQYQIFRHDPGNPKSLSNNVVTSIAEDKLDNIWVGTQNGGIDLYQPLTATFTSFIHTAHDRSALIGNDIRKIMVDKRGRLWIGTQEGLSMMDPVTKTFVNNKHLASNKESLSQNSVYDIFQDNCGSVWVGTYFGGVNVNYAYATPFSIWKSRDRKYSLSNNVVSSIIEDENYNLWVGTEGGGLNYFDRKNDRFIIYKNIQGDTTSLGSDLVKIIYRDREGDVWVGTHGGGLNLFNATKRNFRRFLYQEGSFETKNSEIASLIEDHLGRLWVGLQSGLKVYRKEKSSLRVLPLKPPLELGKQPVKAFLEDAHQTLWIGTHSGLYMFKGERFTKINSSAVNCIIQDDNGWIWTGLSDGLSVFKPSSGEHLTFTEKDGLPNNNVFGILQDRNKNLWISTNNGLAKYNPATKIFNVYTTSDGLAGNEFNYNAYFKDSKGAFFFGGFNGLTGFYPDSIQANTYIAPMVLTGLSMFNQPVGTNENGILKNDIGVTKRISFQHNQHIFTIEFSLLNYVKSEKNKYAYMLKGIDKDWNETGLPSATYTNLPAGDYTFLVKGANNDGLWSAATCIQIEILPPFWRTWWAYCLYILLIAVILFFITRYFFLRELLKKEKALHQVKLNFFTNISHEIRTHLTLIQTPVDQLLDTDPTDYSIEQALHHIKDNSGRLLKLVNELMDFRKSETGHFQLFIVRYDLIAFLDEIYQPFQVLAKDKNIKISFLHSESEIAVYFDRQQLSKVFFNLISNAFKFTAPGGQINLFVEQNNNKIKIQISDNGCGISAENIDKLFTNFFQVTDSHTQNTGYGIGLALSKNIVEMHKGSLLVESMPATMQKEANTCFTVILLSGNQHFENLRNVQLIENTEQQPSLDSDKDMPIIAEKATQRVDPAHTTAKKFTLLVVEDNLLLRSMIVELLDPYYYLLENEAGDAGWHTATQQIPDLIISDIMMPGMNGLEFCEKLKTDERTCHIPVILLTAKDAQDDLLSGLETGADAYLTKPFHTRNLRLTIRNLLAFREKIREHIHRNIVLTESDGSISPSGLTDEAIHVHQLDRGFLERVSSIIEEHMEDPEFGVAMLSRKVAMSAPILYKKLDAVTGMSVNNFIKTIRLKRAAQLLLQKQNAIYEVAYAVGYSDRKYFSKEFKKMFGKSPSEYINETLRR